MSDLDPRLIALLTRRQFEINTLASVAIEFPALRPFLQAAQNTGEAMFPTSEVERSEP